MLEAVKLTFNYEKTFELQYPKETKVIVINVKLPTIDNIPNLKSVSYVVNRNEFVEKYISESQLKKTYNAVLYQLILLYIAVIYSKEKDYDLIESIIMNGYVDTKDKSTGKSISPIIASINVTREQFNEINLKHVDAIAWFRATKGVSAPQLSNLTPVMPILKLNKNDNRFIEGYGVIDNIDESINLADIDWQDFENLIRELFEKEFSFNGGEVKITQASRDGGVDAVAFDPDPIRGRKIVIQAKRYNNTVGVNAVRDLYGTVVNEGTTKGILVTTSNYGSDAHSFSSGKPLTLLDGGHLLGLLQKHGYNTTIKTTVRPNASKQSKVRNN